MPWQLSILISILAIITTNLIQRKNAQKSVLPPAVPPAMSYLLGVMPLGIAAGLLMPHEVSWTPWIVFLVAMNSLVMAVSVGLGFKAVKHMPVVQFQTIGLLYIVVTIILAWVFLDEGLTKYQVISTVFLFCGALLAVRAPIRKSNTTHAAQHLGTTLIAVAAAASLGTALVIEKAALGYMDIGAYLIFGYSAQAITMLLLAAVEIHRDKPAIGKINRRELKWSAIMGITNGIGGIFYVFAIVSADNISVVAAVSSITLPLIALAAFSILHERENLKLLWSALAFGFIGLLISAVK